MHNLHEALPAKRHKYVNARRATEILIFPITYMIVLIAGVSDTEDPGRNEGLHLLRQAIHDVTTDGKIIRRAQVVAEELIIKPFREEEALVAKLGIALFYVLKCAADQDKIIVGGSSYLSKALDILIPALEDWAGITRLDASAEKAGRKILERLQKDGYLTDVIWEQPH